MDRSHMLQNLRTARSASGPGPLSPAEYAFTGNTNLNGFNPFPSQDNGLNLLLHQANQQNQKLMLLQAQAQVAALLAAQGKGSIHDAQALQMEVMKLQAVQQQQNFQQQLILQQQLASHQQQPRRMSDFQQAGQQQQQSPVDARAQLRNRMGLPTPEAPQTPTKLNPHAAAFVIGSGRPSLTLKSPESTTVISGGTSLGSPVQSTPFSPNPTKSDSSSSWRRPSRAGSVSPPAAATKTRPSPLRFGSPGGSEGSGSGSRTGEEGDSTPPSSAGAGSDSHKRVYEGLGIGRPEVVVGAGRPVAVSMPLAIKVEPIRQPVGPPCAVDELGAMNFASRMRKRVVNGAVGALVEARERREAAGQA